MRVLPLAVAALVVLGAGAYLLDEQPGDKPARAAVGCEGTVADVTLNVQLGSSRPVKANWVLGLGRASHAEFSDARWKRGFTDVTCPEDVELRVNALDIWGGKTHCWIDVNGAKVAESRTTARTECFVRVELNR